MSDAESSNERAHPPAYRSLAALLLVPAVAALTTWLAPRLSFGVALADAVAAAWGVVPVLAALSLAARPPLPRSRWLLALLVLGGALLLLVDRTGLHSGSLWAQPFGLTLAAFALGSLVGSRVEHPGHVLPAVMVAATADVFSVLSPAGLSHAIAESDRALSLLVIASAVPGTSELTFVLGVGDLIIASLMLAVAGRFAVARGRLVVALLLGTGSAIVASALTQAPIPALVTIGLFAIVLVPAFRRVRAEDRRTAAVAALLCFGALLVGALR